MLKRTFETALPIATELAEAGIALNARPSSIIQELCSFSDPFIVEEVGPEDSTKVFAEHVDINTSSKSGLAWCSSFDNTASTIGRIVRGQIQYIKGVIVPRVEEFMRETAVFVDGINNHNPISEFEIKICRIPEIFQDKDFLDLLAPHIGKRPAAPTSYTTAIDFTNKVTDFNEIISLSNPRLDDLIAKWSVTLEPTILESVWYSFFVGGTHMRSYTGLFMDRSRLQSPDLYGSLDYCLAYFLMSNYYLTHTPDAVVNQSSQELENVIAAHNEYSARLICELLTDINDSISSNEVICFNKFKDKQIFVNEGPYAEFIKQGYTPEILIGNMVSGTPVRKLEKFIERIEAIKTAWEQYKRVNTEVLDYKKAATLRDFYVNLAAKFMTPDFVDKTEEEMHKSGNINTAVVIHSTSAYLSTLSKEELVDIAAVSRKIVAGIKYKLTYAEQYLEDMQKCAVANPNIKVEEAAFMATLNYVTDYLLNQVTVAKR